MDFGLPGGRIAGGPATAPAASFPAPSGAQSPADPVGGGLSASAFVDLMNGFSGAAAMPALEQDERPPAALIPVTTNDRPRRFDAGSDFDATAVDVLPPVFLFDVPSEIRTVPPVPLWADAGAAPRTEESDEAPDHGVELLTATALVPVVPRDQVPTPPRTQAASPVPSHNESGNHPQLVSAEVHQSSAIPAPITRKSQEPDVVTLVPGAGVPAPDVADGAAGADTGHEDANAAGEHQEAPSPSSRAADRANTRAAFIETRHPGLEDAQTPVPARRGLRSPSAPSSAIDAAEQPARSTITHALPATPGIAPAIAFTSPAHRAVLLDAPAEAEQAFPRETAQQIIQSIRLSWTKNGGEARITLDPRQFGDLAVTMRVDRGQVVASLQAESSAVREWIRNNQDVLRAGLAEHQLRLDRFEVRATEDARDARREDGGQPRDREARSSGHRRRGQQQGEVFDIVA